MFSEQILVYVDSSFGKKKKKKKKKKKGGGGGGRADH
jgi:hypothetical protein